MDKTISTFLLPPSNITFLMKQKSRNVFNAVLSSVPPFVGQIRNKLPMNQSGFNIYLKVGMS